MGEGLHDEELAINVPLILPWSLSDLLAVGPIGFVESEDDTRRRLSAEEKRERARALWDN